MKMQEKKKSFWDIKGVYVVTTVLLAFFFSGFGQIFGGIITIPLRTIHNDAVKVWRFYASDIGVWIFVFAYVWLVKTNRPIWSALSTKRRGNNIKMALLGIIFGAGLNLICAFSAIMDKDIYLHFDNFNIITFILLLVAVGIQSGAEELVTRVFVYQRLRKVFRNPLAAIIGNAVFFSLLHFANPGITVLAMINIGLTGLLFSLLVYFFDSPWMAIVAHTTWNFNQNILLGLPNSGIVFPYSIFKLDSANARDSLEYSTAFGLEGTAMACIVLAIAIVIVVIIGRKYKLSSDSVWDLADNEALKMAVSEEK